MKKIIGYALRAISIFLFFIILFGLLRAFTSKRAYDNGIPGFIGYMIGSLLVLGTFFWGNLFLYKYSGKLIYPDKNKSEIDEIGKE